MKKLFALALLALAVLSAGAVANPIKSPWGQLVPTPDPARTDLMICDRHVGLMNIYVVLHQLPFGATGIEFSAPKPPCFTALYVADTFPFAVTIGNSQIGVAIGFGACLWSPIHVLTMSYFAFGTTPMDCVYLTQPAPYKPSGRIEVADCNYEVVEIPNGGNYINPPEAACFPTPVEAATWGRVKSLFTD